MKLNLVADYEIGGKCFCQAKAIDDSNNLVHLLGITEICVPLSNGKWGWLKARHLLMCKSLKFAQEVANAWECEYKLQGRLWDGKPIDATLFVKEAEAGSEVA